MKKGSKILLMVAIYIYTIAILPAQPHYNAWFRATSSVPVANKLKIDNEFQHRRQNGFDNTNMFDKNLMFTFRNWLHYQHNKKVKLSVSPFAYFVNYKIIQKQADETVKPNKEVRFSLALSTQHLILKKTYVVDRTIIEYRLFQGNQPNLVRLRTRLGFRYDFTEKIQLSFSDEVLLNIAGTTYEHLFDHNRVGFDLEYGILPGLKLDMGYLYIVRLPTKSTTKLYENNFFINLTYLLLKINKKT